MLAVPRLIKHFQAAVKLELPPVGSLPTPLLAQSEILLLSKASSRGQFRAFSLRKASLPVSL